MILDTQKSCDVTAAKCTQNPHVYQASWSEIILYKREKKGKKSSVTESRFLGDGKSHFAAVSFFNSLMQLFLSLI